MVQLDLQGWTEERRALWDRIRAHDFSPPVPFSFTKRLAREQRWSVAFTCGAIEEYRRFCFLAAACAPSVTPSEEVDQVWHLHLIYSLDYWDVWCRQVLHMRLHHVPGSGDGAEHRAFRQQYAETLALYEQFFGPPPEAYWPEAYRRFTAHPASVWHRIAHGVAAWIP